MNKEPFRDYLLKIFVKSFFRSGPFLGLVVFIIVINLIFLLIGHGDWVPAKFHWLNKLFFWR